MNVTHKIILARHSETVWNEQLRYIGRTDLPLSKLGRDHASMLAEFLSAEPVTAVYASPMRRAMETAGPPAAARGLQIVVEPELREIDFGDWEGLTFDEIASAYPDLADMWVEDPFSVRMPGGEPMDRFVARVRDAWAAIRTAIIADGQAGVNGTTLIVTHAGCIKVILGGIMGLSDHKIWEIYQDKGALNEVELSPDEDRILEINDIRYRERAPDE